MRKANNVGENIANGSVISEKKERTITVHSPLIMKKNKLNYMETFMKTGRWSE